MNLQTNFFACCKNESGDELHLGSSCRRLELFPEFLDNGEADPRCCHQVHCVYCGHCDDADASIVLFLFHININHSTSDTSSTLKWNYQDWHLQIPVCFQVYWWKIFRDLRQNIFMKVAAACGDGGAPRMWPAGRTRCHGVTQTSYENWRIWSGETRSDAAGGYTWEMSRAHMWLISVAVNKYIFQIPIFSYNLYFENS